ncbi:MORF4 family-associated protein 1-like 1 [Manis javanica]|nr:MORF4 family-associated protein 1-like 1 [Manis javanica]
MTTWSSPCAGRAAVAHPRAQAPQPGHGRAGLDVRGLVLNERSRRVSVFGREIDLSPSEFALLAALIRRPDQVFSRHMLEEEVLPGAGAMRATAWRCTPSLRRQIGEGYVRTAVVLVVVWIALGALLMVEFQSDASERDPLRHDAVLAVAGPLLDRPAALQEALARIDLARRTEGQLPGQPRWRVNMMVWHGPQLLFVSPGLSAPIVQTATDRIETVTAAGNAGAP